MKRYLILVIFICLVLTGNAQSSNQAIKTATEKEAIVTEPEIRYIVRFRIKQSTFTLRLSEHIKNRINAIEVEIPVEKSFYDKVYIGTDITNSFKYGSLIFNGDFSTLHMEVIGKRKEKR